MRYAIFSDLHANRQAWAAVREDIASRSVDVLICLGDVVGYGPKPQEVLESVYAVTQNFVLGNHDAVIANRLDPENFNDHAREVIEWTRDHLNEDARQFFSEVPMTIEGAGFLAVHAEAVEPGRFSYIVEAEDARLSFEACKEKIIFVGHTHHPGRFELSGRQIEKFGSEDFNLEKGKRYIVNTGSVGEPRTPDIQASYCIYDSFQKKVTFRKLPFDVEGYKQDLLEVGLPIRPYFLEVYESGGAMGAHQPAELAMKRTPKILAGASPVGRAQRVVVRKDGEPHLERSFSTAAAAYRAAGSKRKEGKGAGFWVVLLAGVALAGGVGIFALATGDGAGDDGGLGAPAAGVDEVVIGEVVQVPDDITWSNLAVSGYKNLAREAMITSDGNPAEWDSKGEAAMVDGDPETFLKKVDGKGTYLVAARFNQPTKMSALSLSGRTQGENAAVDFDVYADDRKILSVEGAVYEENRVLVALPEVRALVLELRMAESVTGAPAIREFGIYDWDVEETGAVAAVKPPDGGAAPESAEGERTVEGGNGGNVAKPAPREEMEPHRPINGPGGQTFFVPTAREGGGKWNYTTEAPLSDWMLPQFAADERWQVGEAGFGQGAPYQSELRTVWATDDIWMRTRFEIPAKDLDRARTWSLLLRNDNGCEVYLNGKKIFSPRTYNPQYVAILMSDEVKGALQDGVNVLAVHCNQEGGDQFIDVGVVSIAAGTPIPGTGGAGAVAKWGSNSLLEEFTNLASGAKVRRTDNRELADAASGEKHLIDGDAATRWRGEGGSSSYVLEINFGKQVEMGAVTVAAGDQGTPREVEIRIGHQRLHATGLPFDEKRQLIPLGRLAKSDKLTLTVKAWDGDAPEIRELGVYRLDDAGKKKPAEPEVKPPAPAAPAAPAAPEVKVVRLQRGADGFQRFADVRIGHGTVEGSTQSTRGINMGGEPRLILGTKEGQVNRVLMRVDIAEKVPAGAKLGEGKLTLSVVNGKKDEMVEIYLIHPKNTLWVEGEGRLVGGGAPGGSGATWLAPDASGSNKWHGGDGLGEPGISSGYLSRTEKGTEPVSIGKVDEGKKLLEFTIPANVMALWADPATNTGILLRIPEEDPAVDRLISVHSSEFGEQGKRPILEVRFEVE